MLANPQKNLYEETPYMRIKLNDCVLTVLKMMGSWIVIAINYFSSTNCEI